MRNIVFDIETKNLFQDVGSNDPVALDISVVCLHDSATDEYSSYEVHEFGKLWPIFEKADQLITFNGDHFDIPLLNKYYEGDLSRLKSLDLLKEVRQSLGRRIKLDTLAEATLGKKKIGNGLEAIVWWRNGEKEKVKKYCLEDVKITKELYEYILKHGHCKYTDGGKIKDIKIDTSTWRTKEEKAMTYTLPF